MWWGGFYVFFSSLESCCLIILFLFSLISFSADANKQQKLQEQQEEFDSAQPSTELKSASVLADQDQRKALKFGFSSKGGTSKVWLGILIFYIT